MSGRMPLNAEVEIPGVWIIRCRVFPRLEIQMTHSDRPNFTPARSLAPSPYNWPQLAHLAAPYGVDPQVMLDMLVAQGDRLLGQLGDDQVIRELFFAAGSPSRPELVADLAEDDAWRLRDITAEQDD